MSAIDRLKRLAEFVPDLTSTEPAGTWSRPADLTLRVTRPDGSERELTASMLPHVVYSDIAGRFLEMVYDAGWVDPAFDWGAWTRTPEAGILEHPEAIATADETMITRIITCIVRQDRFDEGALLYHFENGTILALAQRARALLVGAS